MLPPAMRPMLAQTAQAPFDSAQHLFEIKWDGIRCLAFIDDKGMRLQSRQLFDITAQFPELGCLRQLPSGTVLDGELIILQQGKPSLRHVQKRVFLENGRRIEVLSRALPVTYMVFDVPYLEGKPILGEPLHRRRNALESVIRRLALPAVLVPEVIRQNGCQLFCQTVRLELEGIMAKHVDSPYLPGKRSRHWLKLKTEHVLARTDS